MVKQVAESGGHLAERKPGGKRRADLGEQLGDEPANVVADIAIGARRPMPAVRARTPNERPKAAAAGSSGRMARAPTEKPSLSTSAPTRDESAYGTPCEDATRRRSAWARYATMAMLTTIPPAFRRLGLWFSS